MGSTTLVWHPGVVLTPMELTLEIINQIKETLTPAQVIAITMWREAEGRLHQGHWVPNPIDAMVDVLNVITNRVLDHRWQARGYKGVCLQRWAFSCWEPNGGPDDPKDGDTLAENFEIVIYAAQRMLSGVNPSGKLAECLDIAEGALFTPPLDTLDGACHYYAEWYPAPKWATTGTAREVCRRWGHVFVRGVK